MSVQIKRFGLVVLCSIGLLACPSREERSGAPCFEDSACPDGYCAGGGYFPGRCEFYTLIDSPCGEDIPRCEPAAEGCFDGKCRVSNLGDACTKDEECYVNDGICASGRPEDPLICTKSSSYQGSFCREDVPCKGLDYCLLQPDKNYGYCKPRVGPSKACSVDGVPCAGSFECLEGQGNQMRCVHRINQTCATTFECQLGLRCYVGECLDEKSIAKREREKAIADMSDMPEMSDMASSDATSDMPVGDMGQDITQDMPTSDMNADMLKDVGMD